MEIPAWQRCVAISRQTVAMECDTKMRSVFTLVSKAIRTGKNYWQHMQIGRSERYSVERMLALRDYYEQASLLRVLFVCFVTPLPAFTAVILIECIPLASPAKGWRANYAFWIRLFLSSFPMAVGGVLQVKQVVPPGVISNRLTFLIGLGTAVGYVSCAIALAALWTFPVPFGYALMVGPFVLFFMASFCSCSRAENVLEAIASADPSTIVSSCGTRRPCRLLPTILRHISPAFRFLPDLLRLSAADN
ncbi:hypothetical protein ON010_g18428 [Phytophthora cinnamomi]|nr:hypothetical protein ON010_g18428 [Phytophthora cinnamomi]